jgi:hypothetical protein
MMILSNELILLLVAIHESWWRALWRLLCYKIDPRRWFTAAVLYILDKTGYTCKSKEGVRHWHTCAVFYLSMEEQIITDACLETHMPHWLSRMLFGSTPLKKKEQPGTRVL